jgi:hypothetical protein
MSTFGCATQNSRLAGMRMPIIFQLPGKSYRVICSRILYMEHPFARIAAG